MHLYFMPTSDSTGPHIAVALTLAPLPTHIGLRNSPEHIIIGVQQAALRHVACHVFKQPARPRRDGYPALAQALMLRYRSTC